MTNCCISDDERSLATSLSITEVTASSDESLNQERSMRRHAVFAKTNAVSKFTPVPHPELWRRCLEMVGKTQVKFEDAAIGARDILERCGVIVPAKEHPDVNELSSQEVATVQHLTEVLSYFQRIVAPSGSLEGVKYTARIDSSIGPDGKKCPKYHVDNVHARLIMGIIGPGCIYVPENIVDEGNEAEYLPRVVSRHMLGCMARTTNKANKLIVPPKVLRNFQDSPVKNAREGEALLLMGRLWQDLSPSSCSADCNDDACKSKGAMITMEDKLLAAVHRSPDMKPGQERVLLVVDLVDW